MPGTAGQLKWKSDREDLVRTLRYIIFLVQLLVGPASEPVQNVPQQLWTPQTPPERQGGKETRRGYATNCFPVNADSHDHPRRLNRRFLAHVARRIPRQNGCTDGVRREPGLAHCPISRSLTNAFPVRDHRYRTRKHRG